jgi:hypothetical protein
MSHLTYEPMSGATEMKTTLLEQFCGAPPQLRKRFIQIGEQQGFTAVADMSRERDEAFFGSCVADLRRAGKTDEEVKAFAESLSFLPQDELDFLVALCVQIDAPGRVTFLRGFTEHIQRLFNAPPADTLQ